MLSGRANDVAPTDSVQIISTSSPAALGADIAPGRYRVTRPGELAHGARLDATLDIIDNALNQNSVILTIKPSDYAFQYTGALEQIEENAGEPGRGGSGRLAI